MERINSEKILAEEVGVLDTNSEWLGIPKSHLMECAGYSFAIEVLNKYKLKESSRVVIFCGTGNNGGDGFVIARHLSSFGINIWVILIGSPENIRTEEAKLNWNIISKSLTEFVHIIIIKDSKELSKIQERILAEENNTLLIDGLLGTGIKGKIREPIASAINLINELKKEHPNSTVVSIDVPSGLDPNTGEVYDKAVKSDLVITFHRAKNGLDIKSDFIGEIIVRSIGIPQEAHLFVGRGDFLPTLKIRKPETHKGGFGRLLVIGGSKDYSGAPAYSSLTALNFGLDLVITYTPEVIGDVIRKYSPNYIIRTNPGDWLNLNALPEILELIEWSNSIIIGPGMGQKKETEELLVEILKELQIHPKPCVLDADALKLIKNHLDLIKNQRIILTPHEGELNIITGGILSHIEDVSGRVSAICSLAKNLGTTLLLKGKFDYISDGKRTKINRTGCPEMSIGGTGDVLAGLCGCFLATENELFNSACSAAFLNGYIGEFCKNTIGSRFTAMDMINNLREGISRLL